jgi:predicted nucleic acid-binding Zn ribbon protein
MKKDKKKREQTESAVAIGQVIDNILRSHLPRQAADINRIDRMWQRMVGEIIAENTRPAGLKGKTLLVNVNSSPWLHQLHFIKEEIVGKINAALEDEVVGDILFKIGPV